MNQRGFTLLEVLIALVITGLVPSGLYAGVRLGLRVQASLNRSWDKAADLEGVDQALRRLIAGSDPETQMRGSAGTLDFVSELPEGSGVTSGLAEIALRLDDQHRLVLPWAPRATDPNIHPVGPVRQTALLDNVESLRVSYLDTATSRWESAWTQVSPPGLIRFQVMFREGDARHWPDLVVAPMRDRSLPVGPPRRPGASRQP